MKYPFEDIEPKWQAWWEGQGTYHALNPDKTDKHPSTTLPSGLRPSGPNGRTGKFYGLIEFPYPSGEGLHVGHPRSYTAIDIVTRKKRMEGRNVLYPIGWDAFGLPAENYAIKTKQPPAAVTAKNVANFTRQIRMLGVGFDWSREINTTDPEYYRWTQWMFIRFFESWFDEKMGKARPINELVIPKDVEAQGETAVRAYRDARRLAFKQKTEINWCPKDKIGLANEEAAGGICDRCGGPVEKREKEQWMLRITAYAQRLIDELDQVDYLDKIRTSQINWIGRSEGALINFATTPLSKGEGGISVFTTRPDTLFGATYMVLAPEHALVTQWLEDGTIKNAKEIRTYQTKAKSKSDLERQENKEKTGIQLKGVMAINPATKQEIPVWIADYVLSGYGTGAIMAVPAHDERDFEFAVKFGLPIVEVVTPAQEVAGFGALIQDEDGYLYFQKRDIKTARDPGMITPFGGKLEKGEDIFTCVKRELKEELDLEIDKKEIRSVTIQPSLNTPGEMIKIVHVRIGKSLSKANEGAGVVKLKPDQALKDTMVTEFTKQAIEHQKKRAYAAMTEEGSAVNSDFLDGLETAKATEKMIAWLEKEKVGEKKVNYKLRDWVFSRQRYWGEPIPMINCAHCGWVPMDEEELPLLLPEVKNYEPTDTGESPLSSIKSFVAAKCPICKADAKRETDTMPNWAGSSWYFLRYCDPHSEDSFASEQALKYWMPVDLYNGGMEHTTLHLLYSRFWYKVLFDLGFIPSACGNEPYQVRRSHAMILGEGGVKMSKSKGNVVNPDDVVNEYGADVFRTYEMFIGPYDMDAPWSTRDIQGVRRFLDKVWTLAQAQIKNFELKIKNEKGDQDAKDVQTLSLPHMDVEDVQPYDRLLHQTIKKVGEDIDGLRFNTAVSQLMILTNGLQGKDMRSRDFRTYLKLIAPFAPHMAEELWHQLGNEGSIHHEAWPNYDVTKLVAEAVTIGVQVNGKLRGEIRVAVDADESVVREAAEADPGIQKYLDGQKIKKVIYVKNKILSFVV